MKAKFNIYDYLIVFLIAIVALGQAYQLIKIIGLVSIVYVLYNWRNGALKGDNGVKLYLLILILFNLLSSAWTIDKGLWEKNFMNLIALSFGSMLLITFSEKANNPIKATIYGWIILVSCTIPIALWEIFSNQHLSSVYMERVIYIRGEIDMQKKFAAVTFGNMNSYTTLLSISLPIVLSLIFAEIKTKVRIFILVLSLVITYIIIINSSRGGVFSLIMTVVVFLCFYWKFFRKSFGGILIAIIVALLGCYYGGSVSEQFEQRLAAKGEVLEDEGRSRMLEYGFDIFTNNPLGIGVGNMEYQYSQYPTNGLFIPHNMFMEFLLYGGVIFFLLFIYWIVGIYRRGMKMKSKVIRFIYKASALSFIPATVINSGYFLIPFIWMFGVSIYVISKTEINDDRFF